MGLFSRNIFQSRPKLVLLVDVPSGSVSASLALAYGKKVHLSAIATSSSSVLKRPLRLALRASLEALSRDIHQNQLPLPKEAVVLFTSPSYRSATEIIRYEETSDFKITPELVQKLLDAHYEKVSSKEVISEAHLIGTVVNGYRTQEPYGLFGKTLELFVLKSSLEEKSASTVRDEIGKFFHVPVYLEPFALALGVSLRQASPALEKGAHLVIHMSSRATEMLFFEEGILLESASFPVGSQDLLTSIGRSLRTTLQVLKDKLRLSYKGHGKLSADILRISGREWASLFEKAGEMLIERSPHPDGVTLIAPEEVLLPLESLIKESFLFHRGGRRGLPMVSLNGDSLKRAVVFPGGNIDGALGVSALFAHTHREPLFLSTGSERKPVLG